MIQSKKENQVKSVYIKQKEKVKAIEVRNKAHQKKNMDNLVKLEAFISTRREQLKTKEELLMQKSVEKKEKYVKSLAASFHHSVDKRSYIKDR